jgi:hypothetical protein
VAAAAAAILASSCTPAASGNDAHGADAPPIARVHQRQCGRCHAPPERGSHSRPKLEDAFSRHRKRVRLTSEEWEAMVEYLAAPSTSATTVTEQQR